MIDNIKEIFSYLDYTSLNSTDTTDKIDTLLNDALALEQKGFLVASICTFPIFAQQIVVKTKSSSIKSCCVTSSFPFSMSDIGTKMFDAKNISDKGINELDVVMNSGDLIAGNYDKITNELSAIKAIIGNTTLKVIIETGVLEKDVLIKKACELVIKVKADFIKTSTGKNGTGATPQAVNTICEAIKTNERNTGEQIGIKISGGIKTFEQAWMFREIIKDKLGVTYLNPKLFRLGVSSLISDLKNHIT